MFKNYFYLNRCAVELNHVLKNEIINIAYTQERDKLYFDIGNKDNPNRHLIFSTDPAISYITIRDEHFKAKKNTTNFFENFLPDKISGILTARNDRVIKFELLKSEIYFFTRGSRTNILMVTNDGEIHEFKRIKHHNHIELRNELQGLHYIDSFNYQKDDSSYDNLNDFEKPHISKEIKQEAAARLNLQNTTSGNIIVSNVVKEFFHEQIAVEYSDELNKPFMCPVKFISFPITNNVLRFTKYYEAINAYLILKYKNETISKVKTEIGKYLSKELERLSNKLNELRKRMENGSNEELYKHYGNLLLTNRHLLIKGLESIELTDYITNESIKIKLDPKMAPQQSIDYYFEKSRGEKINFLKSEKLFTDSKKRYDYLIGVKHDFEKAENLNDFISIKNNLNLGSKNILVRHMEEQIKYRHFIIDGKYNVYVGRDNANNDLLTTRFAKQNDYWFHARSVPGSHVVLRVDNPKEGIPKNILKNTASIAAFYSKAKTSKVAPVTYTFAKYVYKKKGLDPGQVIITKENVLLAKPEIPNNCVHIEN